MFKSGLPQLHQVYRHKAQVQDARLFQEISKPKKIIKDIKRQISQTIAIG